MNGGESVCDVVRLWVLLEGFMCMVTVEGCPLRFDIGMHKIGREVPE